MAIVNIATAARKRARTELVKITNVLSDDKLSMYFARLVEAMDKNDRKRNSNNR